MEELIEDLLGVIGSAFESDEYRSRAQAIEKDVERHQEALISDIKEEAERNGIALISTSSGFTLAPLRDGEPLTRKSSRTSARKSARPSRRISSASRTSWRPPA
jgi:hypothetical protein